MAEATQQFRVIGISCPLGDDVFLFEQMTGTETLGRLFEYRVDVLSEDPDIDFDRILGENITLRLELMDEGSTRYLNGFACQFEQLEEAGLYARYRLTLRPWLWFLTRSADCRIFQNQTVPEIVEAVIREQGFSDLENRLQGSFPQREYCVQYRETDFNFVSRLLEEEGIYYYFLHDNGKHVMVLANSPDAHETVPDYEEVPYYPPDQHDHRERDYISGWLASRQIQPGAYALNDFDFEAPHKGLRKVKPLPRGHAQANREIYDYPGGYTQPGDGDHYAEIRIQELQAQHEMIQAAGNARGLHPGCLFSLVNHPRRDQNRTYLAVGASYQLRSDEYRSGGGGGGAFYEADFQLLPVEHYFRPARITPKPVVQGPQTAVVVGKKGEEIWTDKYGRVKCHFHWDRHDKADENSSCWIRVSQPLAGKGWGGINIPRIGQEVIVEFLEGDPDLPIITGRVYNGANMPPYGLPQHQTRSAIKTNSSKGGAGFNEIRFEDKKGEEQLFFHAERNQDVRVKNDSLEWVGRQRHLIVKEDQLERVDGDKHLHIKEGKSGKGNQFEKVDGDKHQSVGGDHNQKVDGTISLTVAGDLQEKIGGAQATQVGSDIHLKAGMNLILEAGMTITLKAGPSFVVVGPSGVAISGPMVQLNSGGSPTSGAGAQPDAPTAPKPALEADNAKPGEIAEVATTPIGKSGESPNSAQVQALKKAADNGTPFCEICEQVQQSRQADQQPGAAAQTPAAPDPGPQSPPPPDDGPAADLPPEEPWS